MELMFGIAIVAIITTHALKASITDVSYAVRGKTSPRMKLRMKQLEAAAANGGRPVRYGAGGYLADLIDDSWIKARERREAKLADPTAVKEKGPMRRYTGKVWADRWEAAGRKHDQNWHKRCVKAGLADPDAPIPHQGKRTTTGDTDATGTSEPTTPRFAPHNEGDFRSDTNENFGADDVRRYGEWSKTQLPPEQHDEIDAWVRQANSHGHLWRQLSEVQEDRDSWLSGKHINHPKNLAEWSDVVSQRLEQIRQGDHRLWESLVDLKTKEKINHRILAKAKQHGISDDPDSPERQAFMKAEGEAVGIKTLYLQRHHPDDWQKRLWDWAHSDLEPVTPATDHQPDNQTTPVVANQRTAEVIPIDRKKQAEVDLSDHRARAENNQVINPYGKDVNTMSTAELTGLEGTLIWARDNVEEAETMKNDLDQAKASLEAGGVEGTAIDIIGQLSDAYDAIVNHSKVLEEELSKQLTIADAYAAASSGGTRGGTREFVNN